MAMLSIIDLDSHIRRTYSSFAGHRIYFGSENIRVFIELIKMDSFFQREPSAVSCNFDAMTKGGKPVTICIKREAGGSRTAGLRYSIIESVE